MHGDAAADEGAVADFDVPAEHTAVREDHVVAEYTVVRHVRPRHEQAVRPNNRVAAGFRGAVHGDVFTEHGAVANAYAGNNGAIEREVLWVSTDDGEVIDADLLTKAGPSLDDGLRSNDAAGAYLDASLNNGERPDRNVWSELGSGMD
jgi:hypothetical protein